MKTSPSNSTCSAVTAEKADKVSLHQKILAFNSKTSLSKFARSVDNRRRHQKSLSQKRYIMVKFTMKFSRN